MTENPDPKIRQRRIGAEAKAQFLAALRRGDAREDAAASAGFSLMGFYNARARDAAFRAGWTEALATSAAAERRARAYQERDDRAMRGACPERRGEVRIACANRRIYQRRRRRNVRFDAQAQAIFLTHFAGACETRAAAEAAGVCESTVHLHRRTDSVFAEAYAQALAQGYAALETELLRQRLAAQANLRAAIETVGPTAPSRLAPCSECGQSPDADAEFDRVMKLLARHDRKPRRVERGFKPGGRRQRWTFDQAIELLDKKLRAMGARRSGPAEEM